MSLANWFDGPSLLDSDGLCHVINGRELRAGDAVDCYRNLNRPHSFSVKSRQGIFKGLVTDYGRAIVIAYPSFVVGEKSRQRVILERRKNVHSYVRGKLVDMFDGDLLLTNVPAYIRASYSPYAGNSFFQLDRDDEFKPISGSIKPLPSSVLENTSLAIVNGSDVFLLGCELRN